MDIVLDVVDTLFLDYAYARLVPRSYGLSIKRILSSDSIASWGLALDASGEALLGVNHRLESSSPARGPASQYFHLPSSPWASASLLPRESCVRQTISLYLVTWIFGIVIYLGCATLSYAFVFDKETFKHPKFLKNQIRMEIAQALGSLPVMAIFTTPFFLAEVRGYSRLYDVAGSGAAPGLWYSYFQFPFFILFTDFFIYWIHRGLHHPTFYKRLHKPHHKWVMPTPFASHAFHPIDGFSQSIPYHVFPFLFPLQKWAYIILFIFINIWTILIHDGEYVADSPIINGAACHTMHHLYFNYNYGQFTTLWDRLGGSYRQPNEELFQKQTKMDRKEWDRQSHEMEAIQKSVEGEDEREYGLLKKQY